MTLFIAFLLIYHYDMDWWWYALAITIWMPHIAIWDKVTKKLIPRSKHQRVPGGPR